MPILQRLSAGFQALRAPENRGSSLNNPSVPLSAAGFLSWVMGGEPTASGEQVTVASALQQITVYACVRVLAESVASLPVYIYKLSDKGRIVDTDHQLAYLLRWCPNDEMTAFTFWECFIGSMALTGNGYAEIQRDAGGRVVALWPLHPQLTEPKRAPDGDLIYETTDGQPDGKARTILARNMLHVPLFSFNGLKGFSPIHLARQGIGLARAAEKYGAKFFGNGGRPSGVLSSEGRLTPDQIDQMRTTWNQTQGGDAAGSTAVLPGQWKYEQIGLSPEESQFLATRNLQRAEISSIFRVPPHMVGDTTRLSNNNHEQMGLSFVTDTLRPYLGRCESELMRKLIPQIGRNAAAHEIEFDVSERLRGDFQTTMLGYATGKQWGFFNTNMILRNLGENPIGPQGDIFVVPVNMQNMELLLETESVQDQPVGADPNAAKPGEGDPPEPGKTPPEAGKPSAAPTAAERNVLGRYTTAYITVFRDAFSRLLKRDKRDSKAITALIGPVFGSISEAISEKLPIASERRSEISGEIIAAMAKRAGKWPRALDEDGIQALAGAEFNRAIRSLYINTSREHAAQLAIQQLETE